MYISEPSCSISCKKPVACCQRNSRAKKSVNVNAESFQFLLYIFVQLIIHDLFYHKIFLL